MPPKPRAIVLLRPSLYRLLFADETDADLRSLVDATFNRSREDWSSEELAEFIAGFQIAVIFRDVHCQDSVQLECHGLAQPGI